MAVLHAAGVRMRRRLNLERDATLKIDDDIVVMLLMGNLLFMAVILALCVSYLCSVFA